MVKNVVLARVVGSLSEFKQIIGRGTRLNVDYGKEYFNIIDYTGTATIHFADKDFDGEPEFIDETTINKDGETTSVTVEKPDSQEEATIPEQKLEETSDPTPPPEPPLPPDPPPQPPRKFYVDGGEVEIIGHLVYDLDTDGKKLQVVKYTDYSGRMLRSMYPSPEEFRTTWANQDTRIEVLRELAHRGIDFDELAVASNQTDADPFDLLCHLAWNAPLLSRRERADKIKKNPDLFAQHGDTAREILSLLLDKYIERGVIQFHGLSDLMKTPPFNHYGLPAEIANLHFGGVLPMRQAVVQLQETLYQ